MTLKEYLNQENLRTVCKVLSKNRKKMISEETKKKILIEKGNKQIAEFLNLPKGRSGNAWLFSHSWYGDSQLLFHSSWSWLMPGVQKALDLWDNIDNQDPRVKKLFPYIVKLKNALSDVDMERAWKILVQFIEFWSKPEEKQGKKFYVTAETEELIIHRASAEIEADSLEEAQEILLKRMENDDYKDVESEYLIETGTPLTPIQKFLLENEDMCIPDLNEYDLSDYSPRSFPEEENYEL